MRLENADHTVDISIDPTYTVGSADNRPYDIVYDPEGFGRNDFSKTLAITVVRGGEEQRIALIGKFYSYDSDCAILEGARLTVLQDDTLTQLDLSDGTMVFHRRFDCLGCCFGIYPCSGGYLVYGEIEVLKLDRSYEREWSFSGADIFVTQDGASPFELRGDRICLRDWLGNRYELDLNGNLLEQGPAV